MNAGRTETVATVPDEWVQGANYEPYVGRWSRLVATEFVDWLGSSPGQRWLDVGCGTGALTEAIVESAQPDAVVGLDLSTEYVAYARRRIPSARVRFDVADAQALSVPDGSFDLAVSGLALNFVPVPLRALREMARAVRPGGIVAVYVWDYAGQMQMMRHFWDAAVALAPNASALDEGARFPLCRPDSLVSIFHGAGIRGVEARPIDVPTHFRDFDDFWSPFLGGQGPAPSYAMSLSEAARSSLRERIASALPVAPDGSIRLSARAWAVRGVTAA